MTAKDLMRRGHMSPRRAQFETGAKFAHIIRASEDRFELIKWTLEARQIEMHLANKRALNRARRQK